jgi:flagellar motility protein MotE (MotC chaperone)
MLDKGMTLLQTGAGAILAADIEKRIGQLEDELKEAEKIAQEIVDLKKAQELDGALEWIPELNADIKAEEKALEELAVDCDQLYWQEKARIGMG